MKFNKVAAAAALLAGVAYAEDVEESKAVPEIPTFTVSQALPLQIGSFSCCGCCGCYCRSGGMRK